jgi:hypothetical protein
VKPKIQKAALIGGVLGFIFGFGVIFAWDDPNGSPVLFDCLEAPVKGLWWILKHLGIPSGPAGGIFRCDNIWNSCLVVVETEVK